MKLAGRSNADIFRTMNLSAPLTTVTAATATNVSMVDMVPGSSR
jgi:hypothetical protein